LARKGLLFTRAYSPSADTTVALAAWAAARQRWRPQEKLEPRLYLELKRHGYQTFCIIPWRYVSGPFRREEPGCDVYQRLWELSWVEATVKEYLQTVNPARPLFFQVHIMESHSPWPEAGDDRFGHGLHANYLKTISRIDATIGSWIEAFSAKGMLQDAVIIISSDHGESLGERGVFGHQTSLYDEQTRVPLLIWSSRGNRGVHGPPVNTAWLGQTILALSGVLEDTELPGPFIFADEPVYIRQGRLHGLVEHQHKLIFDAASGSAELYDLASDPGERTNLVGRDPARRDRMLQQLRRAAGPWLR
jgi:arylsulfatase A-like enzyme